MKNGVPETYEAPQDGSMIDRSEAVNLALFIKLDKQNTRIADKGVMLLADAVIAMDAVLKGEQA